MFDNLFQGTVFLCFTKLVAAIHSLTDTMFISEQHLQPWLCIYNVFDRYFYLRRIVTSKEHMQPYIWVVPPLLQEATCRDLAFSRVLSFFEISTCNRLCFQRYRVNLLPVEAIDSTNGPFSIIKKQLQPQILSNFKSFWVSRIFVIDSYRLTYLIIHIHLGSSEPLGCLKIKTVASLSRECEPSHQ